MNALALDIGGANLKAVHSGGAVQSVAFPVWRRPHELSTAVTSILDALQRADEVAVTMTAELCDCFDTKHAGVLAVLEAVERAVRNLSGQAPIRVWLNDGRLVPLDEARADPLKAAAANWLALAVWAARLCPRGTSLVIDVGSTTTDIVPVVDGVPVPRGRTDFERLATGELVYSGVRRTPLCALAPKLNVRDREVRTAAEWFATTLDVYTWLGDLPEDPGDCDTADGRPMTRRHSRSRLARTVCADNSMLSDGDITAIAQQAAAAQLAELCRARNAVELGLGDPPAAIVISGSGEFLARRVANVGTTAQIVSIAEQFGPAVSNAACAHALAALALMRR